MADSRDNTTVIGADVRFKGELSFDNQVRFEGNFEGQIRSKGTLHIAEGARIVANIEAANVKIEGECKGNLLVSEKLQLCSTAKVEGDLRTNRLEMTDGAIFIGNVVVGQTASEPSGPRTANAAPVHQPGRPMPIDGARPPVAPGAPGAPVRPAEARIGAGA